MNFCKFVKRMHVLAYEYVYLTILNACFFLVVLHVDCHLVSFVEKFCFHVSFWDHVQYCITWQDVGPHATLILYIDMKSCFPYGESFKLYIACTLWAAF